MPQPKYFIRSPLSRYPDINLPDGVEVVVGRNVLTKVKDFRLSRKHVSLTANENDGNIEAKHIGANCSFWMRKNSVEERKTLGRGSSIFLRPGDALELLEGKFKYQVVERNLAKPLSTMDTNTEKQNLNSSFGSNSNSLSYGRWNASGYSEPHKNHWSQALYATMNDPNMVEFQDDDICIVKDRFPKARHHYLVLPKEKIIDLSYMNEGHVDLVERMVKRAKDLVAKKNLGPYKMGFHCVPSLAQVHMHLITEDFDSQCLKNKKHWNSFNSKYFIDPADVIEYLREDGRVPFEKWSSESKELLNTGLKCHKCEYKPKNLPDLKKHILTHVQ